MTQDRQALIERLQKDYDKRVRLGIDGYEMYFSRKELKHMLALLRAEAGVPGSEVLCPECAVTFCPSGERLHFHHDGCPACAIAKCEGCEKVFEDDEVPHFTSDDVELCAACYNAVPVIDAASENAPTPAPSRPAGGAVKPTFTNAIAGEGLQRGVRGKD